VDYGALIREAWQTTWRHPYVWILGRFAGGAVGVASGGGAGGNGAGGNGAGPGGGVCGGGGAIVAIRRPRRPRRTGRPAPGLGPEQADPVPRPAYPAPGSAFDHAVLGLPLSAQHNPRGRTPGAVLAGAGRC
jgi:hypothetical protein